jgi:hypothetical protein
MVWVRERKGLGTRTLCERFGERWGSLYGVIFL